jgi:hypothetical protein
MAFPGGTKNTRDQLKEAGGQPLPIGAISASQLVYRSGINLIGLTLGTNLVVVGTTLNAAGGGGSTWTEAEVDFLTPSYDYQFTVTDATVGVASKITVIPCGKAATGRTADDWQWDGITFAALPAVGSFTLYATAHPGPVVGKRKIQYSVAS